jgi:ATP-dependent Clp protease protease subunit
MLFKNKKLDEATDHDDEDEEGPEEAGAVIKTALEDSRLIGLFGEVEERKIAQIIGIMLELSETSEVEITSKVDDKEETRIENLPIEFLISTPGGSADDMFSLYDIMRVVRNKCDIETFGLGKVMSAGVLLLASGTKGKRKIGKNCRVMIHSVVGGTHGSFHNLENEMSEMRYMQDAYLKALSEESNMSVAQLKRMIGRKVNVYLSAEEAVKLGIADIIV